MLLISEVGDVSNERKQRTAWFTSSGNTAIMTVAIAVKVLDVASKLELVVAVSNRSLRLGAMLTEPSAIKASTTDGISGKSRTALCVSSLPHRAFALHAALPVGQYRTW